MHQSSDLDNEAVALPSTSNVHISNLLRKQTMGSLVDASCVVRISDRFDRLHLQPCINTIQYDTIYIYIHTYDMHSSFLKTYAAAGGGMSKSWPARRG